MSKNKNAIITARKFISKISISIDSEFIPFEFAHINATGKPPRSSLMGNIVRIIAPSSPFILESVIWVLVTVN